MVLSYPTPMFSQYTAYLRRPYSVTGFINQGGGGCASWIFINISALYVNANVISFSLKHIRV